jgi:phage terminase large subunit
MVSHSIELSEIESYEYIELDDVYDITVEDEHCYFLDCGKYILVHNSGKTYSLIQLLIGLALKSKVSISIVSIAYPHLRKGAIRDWKEIMEAQEIYDPDSHMMTESTYRYPSGGYIEFFSVDNAQKVRGPGRDILFINEANLISQDTFEQLNMRTKQAVFIDYNPADEFHWIYERIIPLPSAAFIQSTFKDNPFLPQVQVDQIKQLESIDPNLWKVYGLGERGTASNTIYHKFELYDKVDLDYCFGLDFGFNHPNALVKVSIEEDRMYLEQKVYKSHQTTPDLIEMIKPIVENKLVYCDSARPDIIQDLRNNGINAYEANKSVKDGIDFMRSHRIFVHRESVDLQKEMRSYKWKQKPNGDVLDEPVKAYDDLLDAARYGAMSLKNSYTAPILTFHR